MFLFAFFLLFAAVVFVAIGRAHQPEAERSAATHATMLVRLKRGLGDPRHLSGAVVEYFADRYRHLHVAHWARVSFEHYLEDPDNAEAVTRARRAAEGIRQAELAAALNLRPDLLPRASFALN